jgi:hypothetical protein
MNRVKSQSDLSEILRTVSSWSELFTTFVEDPAATTTPECVVENQAAFRGTLDELQADPNRPCLLRRTRLGASFDTWVPFSEAPAEARAAYLACSTASAIASGSGPSWLSVSNPTLALGAALALTDLLPVEVTEFRAMLRAILPAIRMCPSQRCVLN